MEKLWKWIQKVWNIYQFLLWFGGTSVSAFILHTAVKGIQDAPLGWQIVLYVGIGAFISVAVMLFTPHLWSKLRKNEITSASRIDQTNDKRVNWWNTIADDDRRMLTERVRVISRRTELRLELKNPAVYFRLDILNASVFKVVIGGRVTGRVIYNNEEQNFQLEVQPITIFHGNQIPLELTQRLFPEVAKHIQDAIDSSGNKGTDIRFGFQLVRISIDAELPDGQIEKWNNYLSIVPTEMGSHFRNLNLLK